MYDDSTIFISDVFHTFFSCPFHLDPVRHLPEYNNIHGIYALA
jgi:hypothetical protein